MHHQARITGIVITFDTNKHFGFIKSAQLDKNVFVHANEVKNEHLLHPGQEVEFTLIETKKGFQATHVEIKKSKMTPFSFFLFIAFIMTGALGAYLYQSVPLLESYLLAINIVTAFFYGYDKMSAGSSLLRIPENTLHTLALVGGWPLALFSQNLLRHKTVKKSFRRQQMFVIGVWVVGFVIYKSFNA